MIVKQLANILLLIFINKKRGHQLSPECYASCKSSGFVIPERFNGAIG